MDPIELIAGLGNPGERYAGTRHNAGFWCVERLAARAGAVFRSVPKLLGELCEVVIGGRRVRLLKPTTFMNHSGQAVAAVARYYRVPVERILVVHDDIDLPAGTVRLKSGGGHGGHNGLRDIVVHLGDNRFARLRLGVGHPGQRDAVVGHVLHRAGRDEQADIDDAIERALGEMEVIVRGDIRGAMNVLNRRPVAVREDGEGPDPAGGDGESGG